MGYMYLRACVRVRNVRVCVRKNVSTIDPSKTQVLCYNIVSKNSGLALVRRL